MTRVTRVTLSSRVILNSRLLLLTASVAVRRGARERRRQTERELAAYSSPADLADMQAMIGRYPDTQTLELRSILACQGAARASATRVVGGTVYR